MHDTTGTFELSKPTAFWKKDTDPGRTDCEACSHPMHPHASGRFVPVTCLECASRIPRLSEGSMGCIRCGLAVCQACLSDKMEADTTENPEAGLPRLVLYTSGSTGVPKGALMSEGAFFRELWNGLTKANREKAVVLTSPIAVSSVPSKILSVIGEGGRIAVADDAHFLSALKDVGPTGISLAPQLLATFRRSYYAELAAGAEQDELDRRYRSMLGRRLRLINCGGAKPQRDVMEWAKKVYTHCAITENYAATETGAISFTPSGSVEAELDSEAQYKLEDWGVYKASSDPPQGELCVKTPYMFMGYLKRDDLTKEVIDSEGYYHTGDIVELRIVPGFKQTTYVKVIDRKKAFFKLANSEWVSPAVVESHLVTSNLVSQVFVYGTSEDQAVVAVVVLPEGVAATAADIIADFKRIGSEVGLRRCEVPHAVHISEVPFTAENKLLTITLKLCRPRLQTYFANTLDELRMQCNAKYDEEGRDTVADALMIIKRNMHRDTCDEGDAVAWEELPVRDSIKAVQACLALQHQLGVKLQPAVLLGGHSLQEVIMLCRGGRGEAALDLQGDLEAALPPRVEGPTVEGRAGYLVTGASGFLGSAVVDKLLEAGEQVVALVRSKERFEEAMNARGCSRRPLRVVVGDVGVQGLGLDKDDETLIHQEVGYVIHTAAIVNMLQGYPALKKDNTLAVGNLLRLCSDGKKFLYVSTVGFTPDKVTRCTTVADVRMLDGYNLSKAMGECVVEGARQLGYCVGIVRPGMIGPDVDVGVVNMSDYIARYLVGCREAGSSCQMEGDLYLSSVGYVADIVVANVRDPPLVPVHVPAVAVPLSDLYPLLPPSLPRTSWGNLLSCLPPSNPMYPLRALFRNGIPPMDSHVHTSDCPPPPPYTPTAIETIGAWLSKRAAAIA
eukprot:TRINITY_DN6637_c0_g1_i1.p1 TRINITY_DN6637_c0_g1~~TRINITY_DN6637_c0_g1_i1.p1  ORF type:complete len:1011 (+),score=296.59 TRINITY_DN6637_c0_g1_i1:336-3035(+)